MGMFDDPLVRRVGTAKILGLVMGLFGWLIMDMLWPDLSFQFKLGLVLWYTTLGAMIGMFGLLDWHPVLEWPLPWWFRGAFYGGWFNLLLGLLMYEQLAEMLRMVPSLPSMFHSPFWIVLDGAIAGLIIDYVATRVGGDGPHVLSHRRE